MPECRICNNLAGNEIFTAREMMFGTRDEFDYFECARCGCLQIDAIPPDLSPYYPPEYYSFSLPRPVSLKRYFQRQHTRFTLGQSGAIGWLLSRKYRPPEYVQWVKRAGVAFEDAILDVGCGAGQLLMAMHITGFEDLTGIDPYLAKEVSLGRGLQILRKSMAELDRRFDFIMLHHSFEHLADPLAALKQIRSLLKPEGRVLIRVPVAGSYAWRAYGVDWVQLDAPRHFFLPTSQSLELLAGQAGFSITDITYDSTAFQFWGSEQYRRGIALRSERSYGVNPRNSIFTADEIREFENHAARLNENGEGDQACFYLR